MAAPIEPQGQLQDFLDILRKNQIPTGGWAYYDNPPYSRRPKWATSFCTALVLPALERALDNLEILLRYIGARGYAVAGHAVGGTSHLGAVMHLVAHPNSLQPFLRA